MLYYKATRPVLNRGGITLLSEVVSCGLNEASSKDFSTESHSCSLRYWKGTCGQGELCPIIHKYLVSELTILVKGLRTWPTWPPQLCQMCFMLVTQEPMERILVTIKGSAGWQWICNGNCLCLYWISFKPSTFFNPLSHARSPAILWLKNKCI